MSKARGNLKPFDSERAKECGRLGGIKSGESRRARKTLKEELSAILAAGDNQQRMCLTLYRKAADEGDIKAFRAIADVLGEMGTKKAVAIEHKPLGLFETIAAIEEDLDAE